MPWCDECERYYAPSAMTPEGHCPRCDADLLAPDQAGSEDGSVPPETEKVPWHFKLMIVLLILYLGWRFVDLVV